MGSMRHQPRGLVQVDASNPLARGLVFVQTGAADNGFVPVNGTTTIPFGVGNAKSFSSSSSQYLLATDDKIQSGPLTFFALARPNSLASNKALMSIGASTNDRTGLYTASGRIAMFSGSPSANGQAISTSSLVSGTTYALAGRVMANNSRDVWVDGLRVGTNGTSVSPAAANRIAIGAFWANGAPAAGQGYDGVIQLALAWKRALSDDEMRSIAANPWQVFIEHEDGDDYQSAALETVDGSFNSGLSSVELSAVGTLVNAGAFASVLGDAALVAAGSTGNAPSGSFESILSGAGMASSGAVSNRAALTAMLDGAVLAAVGTVAQKPAGAFATTLQDASMFSDGYLGLEPPQRTARPYRWRVMRRHFSGPP